MIDAATDVAIVHVSGTGDLVDEVAGALRSVGLAVETQESDIGALAGLELLLPTAVSIWLAEKYFGAMLSEAAKDHYALAKAAFSRLVGRTTGPDRQIRLSVVGSPGKVEASDSPILGVYAVLKSGQRVKFVFEHDLPPNARDSAIQSMHETMAAHYLQFPHDALTQAVTAASLTKHRLVVLRFDSSHDAWNPWQPVSVSEQRGD